MRNRMLANLMGIALISLILFTGCDATPAGDTPATTARGAAETPKSTLADAPATTASSETALPTEGAKPVSDAFRYYDLVQLGMAKADVDAALGLEARETKGKYEPENAFNYFDDDGFGVYVIYNKELKVYSKTVIYPHAGEALAPLTKKPVTEAQADSIKKGTAHVAVIESLGGDGVECSVTANENDVTKILGRILRWGNGDDTGIQIAFDSDDVAQNILFFN